MLDDGVKQLLRVRFKHYQDDTPVPFLAAVQPLTTKVDGVSYPALLLANDCWWLCKRDARPEGVKTVAPKGRRRILTAQPDERELLVVEGEGDALAAAFVGYTGLVVAGGVNNLLSAVPEAVAERKALFTGKQVRVLFDPDEPGRKAAVQVARQLLADGAAKVAVCEMPGHEDLEDWLESFDTSEEALRALIDLVAASDWTTDKKLEKAASEQEKEQAPEPVVSERIMVPGDPWPRLVVMTYERARRRVALAMFGPVKEPAAGRYGDVDWSSVPREWKVADRFEVAGRVVVPGCDDDVRQFLRASTLVLPPPPPDKRLRTPELWKALHDFMARWVVHQPHLYNVQVAYVLMTYRLEDAEFQRVPYLRFHGPSGSGKNRALDVIKHLVWRGFFTQPSSANLHRLIDYMGDITLVIDEFHLDRGKTNEARQNIIDVLNYGNDRASVMTRVIEQRGKQSGLRHFKVFGPKVFAGYGADEEDSLARRTVTIQMLQQAHVPESMSPLGLPEAFYEEAEQLRGQLLAFRGAQLERGQPDPMRHPAGAALVQRAGLEVAHTLFPLVSMVPVSMPEVLEDLLVYAESRREAVREAKGVGDDAHVLEAFVHALHFGTGAVVRDGVYYCTAQDVLEQLQFLPDKTVSVAKTLRALGVHSQRPRWASGRRRVYQFDPNDSHDVAILARHSVAWDILDTTKDEEDAGL